MSTLERTLRLIESLPVGYGFRPTDEELVDDYLKSKILGTESHEGIIPVIEAYKMDPWFIPSVCFLLSEIQTYGPEYFFFCPLHKSDTNCNQLQRKTNDGYWKSTGPDLDIKRGATEEVIGTKKTLVFHMGGGRGHEDVNTGWVIHEYRARMAALPANETYVLCRLNTKKGSDFPLQTNLNGVLPRLLSNQETRPMNMVGYGFRPTDEELVDHYLKPKILGTESHEGIIPVIEVYKMDPWFIPDACLLLSEIQTYGPEYFFFTLHKKFPNRNQVQRKTNDGYWKSTSPDLDIKRGATEEVIGTKKTLVFHMGGGRGHEDVNTGWVIHEYRARMAALPANETYVLCRLNTKKGSDFPLQTNLNGVLPRLLSNQETRPMNMDVDDSSTGTGFHLNGPANIMGWVGELLTILPLLLKIISTRRYD